MTIVEVIVSRGICQYDRDRSSHSSPTRSLTQVDLNVVAEQTERVADDAEANALKIDNIKRINRQVDGAINEAQPKAVQNRDGRTRMPLAADSGAVEIIIDPSGAPGYELQESLGSKSGMQFQIASGDRMPNHGQVMLLMRTDDCNLIPISSHCINVHKPLLAVAGMLRVGDLVGPCGQGEWLREDNGNYMLDTWLVQAEEVFEAEVAAQAQADISPTAQPCSSEGFSWDVDLEQRRADGNDCTSLCMVIDVPDNRVELFEHPMTMVRPIIDFRSLRAFRLKNQK